MSTLNKETTYLSALGMTCAAGDGVTSILANLCQGLSPGMITTDRWTPDAALTVGQVTVELPSLENFPKAYHSRNNRLALHTSYQIEKNLRDAIADFGARRIGVVVGTTTSGMTETEKAFLFAQAFGCFPKEFAYAQMELGSLAEFLAQAWGLKGPAMVISTACSSSAKALASGRRLLRLGVCDAVLVGGVDTLCSFTLRGFSALGALSPELCLPFSLNRKGINIGEAAAFFLLRRDYGPVILAGVGETSDAYHISAPLPKGEGACEAMMGSLQDAGIEPNQVGYVNLHGTGTNQNDLMESCAVQETFPSGVPCSSTKPLTGHTLGAAGALEAGICWALLTAKSILEGNSEQGLLPPQLNDGIGDPEIQPLHFVQFGQKVKAPLQYAQSNVFGFGGTNVSLVLGKA